MADTSNLNSPSTVPLLTNSQLGRHVRLLSKTYGPLKIFHRWFWLGLFRSHLHRWLLLTNLTIVAYMAPKELLNYLHHLLVLSCLGNLLKKFFLRWFYIFLWFTCGVIAYLTLTISCYQRCLIGFDRLFLGFVLGEGLGVGDIGFRCFGDVA